MYNPLALKYAPWSFSKVGKLESCVRSFWFRYDQKVDGIAQKSVESRMGTALHAVLEGGLRMPGLDLGPVLHEQIEKNELSRDEVLEATSRLPDILDFIERWQRFKRVNGVKKEYIESQFAISAEHTPAPYFDDPKKPDAPKVFFRGVVDLGGLTADNTLIIIDHKTGKKKAIGDHGKQFYVYMLMAISLFPEVEAVQCAINYLGEPKLDWYPGVDNQPGAWSRYDIARRIDPWMKHYINRAVTKLPTVGAEGKTEKPKAETGWPCSFCEYADAAVCPEGRKVADERAARKKGGSTNL